MKTDKPAKKMATVWVTRWALTQGIHKVEAELSFSGLTASYKTDNWCPTIVHDKDFHLTEEAAKARANEMVARKIIATEKNLTRLKKLVF